MSFLELSIVVPVYNGSEQIESIAEEIVFCLSEKKLSFEIIFIDDGSTDESWKKIIALKGKYKTIHGISLNRNYGQHKASLCGLMHSSGKYVVTMDDDSEHNPEYIADMLQQLKYSNSDVIYGIPKNKKRSLIKSLLVFIYKKVSRVENSDAGNGSSFRILSSSLVEKLKQHTTHLFFLDEILLWYTNKIETFPVDFRKSKKNRSSYNYRSLFSLSKNVFMISTTMPLQLVKFLGISMSSLSFLYGLYHLLHKIFLKTEKGYTSLIISILFSTGLLLLCIGVIGEYLSNLLIMQNNKPAYSVRAKTFSENES